MDTDNTSITLRLPRALRDRIKAEALTSDLSVSQLLRRHLSKEFASSKSRARKEVARA